MPKSDSFPNSDASLFDIGFILADAKSRDKAGESDTFDNRRKVAIADIQHVAFDNPFGLPDNAVRNIHKPVRALPSDASIEQAKEYFKDQTGGDAGTIVDLCNGKEVCNIGERHTSLSSKEYLAENIEALAEKGYNFIAFEMVKQRDQHLLDGYVDGILSSESLLISDALLAYDYAVGAPEGYLKILDAIKDYNSRTGSHVRAIALETDYDVTNSSDSEMKKRNDAWAKKINAVLSANPGAKILTYSGGGHLGHRRDQNTLNTQLSLLGHDSTAIILDATRPKDEVINASRAAAQAATALGASRPFSYQVAADKSGAKRGDFGIFVPWKELPQAEIGKDVTSAQERQHFRTGELALTDGDADGRLYVTTDSNRNILKLEYRTGDLSYEIRPDEAIEMADVSNDGWILFRHGNEKSVRLLRNGINIASVKVDDSTLRQVRGKSRLIYPVLK